MRIEVPQTHLQSLSWEILLLTYRGGGKTKREGEEAEKQQREEAREETPQSQTGDSDRKKSKNRAMKVKWK